MSKIDFEQELLYSRFLLSDGVSIDTRQMRGGEFFFALEGTQRHGSSFVGEAFEKGARFAVIPENTSPPPAWKDRCISVKSVEKALQGTARFHRSRYLRTLIAITGSNGKTTTKELLSCILRKGFIVHATEGNQNNHLGVPLTLLGILPQTEVAIVELGISHRGEMAFLCDMSRPTHGLITHIGLAHTEGLGDLQGILNEKCLLAAHLFTHQKKFYLNEEETELLAYIKTMKEHPAPSPLRYPNAQSDFPISCLQTHPHIRYRLPQGSEGTCKLWGKHNFMNLAGAAAIGLDLGISEKDIIAALQDYQPHSERGELRLIGDHTFLLDSYNANPDGMSLALEALLAYRHQRPEPKLGVLLGDMRELGPHSAKAHQTLGQTLHHAAFTYTFLVGKDMEEAKKYCPKARHFPQLSDLAAYLQKQPPPPAIWLVKGSHSLQMSKILSVFDPKKAISPP